MSSRPVRVLIVGCGNIAGGFDAQRASAESPLTHAGAFLRHGGFQLAACVEPDENKRRDFMARWGIPSGTGSVDDGALRAEHFDLVSICSPTASHGAHLEAALALAPRAIFCEKPVTPTVAETARWVDRCEAAGVALGVNHTRRWAPDLRRLRGELASGRWGALRSVTGWYNKGVLNNGGHMIDLVRWFAGELQLKASGSAVFDHWPDDPSVPALLEAANGVPVQLCTGHAADYALFELQLVTQRAVIVMENGGMSWRVRDSIESPHFKGYRSLSPAKAISGEYAMAMSEAAANLYATVTGGETLASTGMSALAAQRICEEIRDSAVRQPSPDTEPGSR